MCAKFIFLDGSGGIMKINSRNHQIQNNLDRILFGNIFYFMLCWFCLFAFSNEKIDSHWISGIVLLSIGVIGFFLLTILKDKIIKPAFFHYSVFILSLISALLLFDASLTLGEYLTNLQINEVFILLSANVILLIIGVVFQIISLREKLINATSENIKSGRLDLINGIWNLNFPVYFESKEIETRKNKVIHRIASFSPIVTVLTFIIARSIEGKIQTIAVAIVLFMIGFSHVLGHAKHIAIAIQISEWENKNKIKITLS